MPDTTAGVCTFATNVWEKTYVKYLAPGYIAQLIHMHHFPFAERLVVINNVSDRQTATKLADQLVRLGEIDRYVFVADYLDQALQKAHLSLSSLGPISHYTTFNLVALYVSRSPYLMYNDAEVVLLEPGDWITEGIQQLEYNPNISCVNPNYEQAPIEKSEGYEKPFAYFRHYAIDYGFSDHMYLVRTSLLTEPFHQQVHWASLRYPTAPVAPIFEQMMDSYHRVYHCVRLIDRQFIMRHVVEEGASHPDMSLMRHLRLRVNHRLAYHGLQSSYDDGVRRAEEILAPSREHDIHN
jgi:hypothetical protein